MDITTGVGDLVVVREGPHFLIRFTSVDVPANATWRTVAEMIGVCDEIPRLDNVHIDGSAVSINSQDPKVELR